MAALQPKPLLILLDFDETLVDADSSEWVAEKLGACSLFDDLRWAQGLPWHRAMNAVLRALHSQGVSVAQIRDAASLLPIPPETVRVLNAAHALGCRLHILSDANTFFIDAALARHGLDRLFAQIHSNPAWVDHTGCLHYDDYHRPGLPPHNCPMCPPNMCKGSILQLIRAAAIRSPASLRVIYCGDGAGDLCPALRLLEGDCVLPRQGYILSKLLAQHPVQASVHPWMNLAATLHDTVTGCVTSSDHDIRPCCVGDSSSLALSPSSGPHGFAANRPGIGFHSTLKVKRFAEHRRSIFKCQVFNFPRSVHFGNDQRKYSAFYGRALQFSERRKAWNLSQTEFCSTGIAYWNPICCFA